MTGMGRLVRLIRSVPSLFVIGIFSSTNMLFPQELSLLDAPGLRYREMAQTFHSVSTRPAEADSIFLLQNVQKNALKQVFQTNAPISISIDGIVFHGIVPSK